MATGSVSLASRESTWLSFMASVSAVRISRPGHVKFPDLAVNRLGYTLKRIGVSRSAARCRRPLSAANVRRLEC